MAISQYGSRVGLYACGFYGYQDTLSRANFSTVLTASQASSYSIFSAVGSDYASWVDSAYLV